jgi:hypothetical protein
MCMCMKCFLLMYYLIFDSHITTEGWNTFSIPAGAKNVTKIRFQGKKSGTAGNMYVFEVVFINVLPSGLDCAE